MTNYYDNVFIIDKFSFLASDKFNPVIIDNTDKFKNDYYMGEKTIEQAESRYQEETIKGLLNKRNIRSKDVDLLISGDLQNQILSSTLASSKFKIPTLGIYSACATFIEGLIIASNIIDKSSKRVIVTSSSHNLVSEKQFRYPVEYGAVRKRVNTLTASGSISVLLSNEESNIKVESSTIGSIYQTNHKDANDMGSAMAVSCTEVIHKHLRDTKRESNYYDLILTGDLGIYGVKILKEYYKKKYKSELSNVIDAGSIFYTEENIFAGCSGPACLALTFFDYILTNKKYKRILLVGTGSLHSLISTNLKICIPSISHAISLEVKY